MAFESSYRNGFWVLTELKRIIGKDSWSQDTTPPCACYCGSAVERRHEATHKIGVQVRAFTMRAIMQSFKTQATSSRTF